MLLFISDAFNWSKVMVKRFIMLQVILFQIGAVVLNFLFIKESWKILLNHKILRSTTVFNIDNNQKCFLSSKSVYYYDFWRSCDTEDWSNDAENTAPHHWNKLHLTIYSHRKLFFFNCNNISQFELFLLYFWSNKCRRDFQNNNLKKSYKPQTFE